MSTQVIMPQMGESIAEGTITQWFKGVGDRVEKDEPLFEISTDKVDAEIPAPASGFLAEIRVAESQTVPVETVVALISEKPPAADGGAPARSAPASAADATTGTSASGAAAKPGASAPGATTWAAPGGPAKTGSPAMPAEKNLEAGLASREALRRTRSSPLVRKMAREHHVDISQIQGTGLSGRVTKKDMLAHLERRKAGPAAAARPLAASTGPVAPPAAGVAAADRAAATAPSPPDRYRYKPTGSDRMEPFSPMRQQIADHMVISRDTSVHVTTVFEVDMTRVVRLREAWKDRYASDGVKLTYMPFVMKAVIDGLREYPVLNASIVEHQICYKPQIHLGVAVALDRGLLVPVVRQADEKSLKGLARAVGDLAERARAKKLSPEEVQGGTFTLTNPGIFGSLFGTPIINQPQVAILGVGSINKRPVVTEDDAIAIRHMMYLALSFDHRIIDGATADRFMARVKQALQEFPEGLL